ncbi:MAG: hypothetical protein ACK55Z_23295 [bacterium]
MGCEKQSINQPREKKEMSRRDVGTVPFYMAGGWGKICLVRQGDLTMGTPQYERNRLCKY